MPGRRKLMREESLYGWLFVAPHVLGLLIFTIGAIVASGYLSLTKWDLFGAPQWVGLDNYRRLADDEIFWKSLWNTLYYTGFRVPFSLLFSLIVALLMNLKIRGILWWRVIYFAPAVSSSVAIALVWRWIYSKDFGILNSMLSWFGVPALNWLGSEELAMPALIKAYLRLGGYIGEGAFVDFAFKTVDVCLILDRDSISTRQKMLYSGDLLKS